MLHYQEIVWSISKRSGNRTAWGTTFAHLLMHLGWALLKMASGMLTIHLEILTTICHQYNGMPLSVCNGPNICTAIKLNGTAICYSMLTGHVSLDIGSAIHPKGSVANTSQSTSLQQMRPNYCSISLRFVPKYCSIPLSTMRISTAKALQNVAATRWHKPNENVCVLISEVLSCRSSILRWSSNKREYALHCDEFFMELYV